MSLIPKKIYQSWKTKNLKPEIAKVVEKTKRDNPEYEYELFDDKDCRDFILQYFGENYANAFDILIPGAFKCDLWRYCILYVKGGAYLDIDLEPLVPLKEIIKPEDQFVSVVDRSIFNNSGIYQAFLACVPGHPIIKTSLELSFYNIASRRNEMLDQLKITGPVVVAIAMNLYWNRKDTNTFIEPGNYPGNIVLYRNKGENVYSGDKPIIKNKIEGYKPGAGNYSYALSYYKDDPKLSFRKKIYGSILVVIILMILGLIGSYIYRKKFKTCELSCSKSSSE
jgi:hypothetical protein